MSHRYSAGKSGTIRGTKTDCKERSHLMAWETQTMRLAFQQICAGEREWTALGNFMNYWYSYAKDRREELVADPLPAYDEQSLHDHRWAVFCAASVEWFCHKYHVACPEWVHDPKYTLAEPWYFYKNLFGHETESQREKLRQVTPEEFTRRNVYCGDNCYDNKWEASERVRERAQMIMRMSKEERREFWKAQGMKVQRGVW